MGLFVCLLNVFALRAAVGKAGDSVSASSPLQLPSLSFGYRRSAEQKAEEEVLNAFMELLEASLQDDQTSGARNLRGGDYAAAKSDVTQQGGGAVDRPQTPAALADFKGCANAAASSSHSSSTAASAATPSGPDPTSIYTQQTCYLGTDESEICMYDNAICFDGQGPVVLVAKPIREPKRVLDYTHECLDGRFYEPSALEWSNCHWAYAQKRPYTAASVVGVSGVGQIAGAAPAGGAAGGGARAASDSGGAGEPLSSAYSLPLGLRRWGPTNRNTGLIFRELHPVEVLGAGEEGIASGGGGSGGDSHATTNPLDVLAAVDAADAASHPEVSELRVKMRYKVPIEVVRKVYDTTDDGAGSGTADSAGGSGDPNEIDGKPHEMEVEWLEGSLWMAGFEPQWGFNPFHFLSKVSMLFDAQRNNATHGTGSSNGASYGAGGHPNDGFVHWQSDSDVAVARSIKKLESGSGSADARSKALWRYGGQWGPLPSIDNLLFVGPGTDIIKSKDMLGAWFNGVLALSTQPQTRTFFSDVGSKYGPNKLLCARKGGIVGTKYRVFSGRSDAIQFRNMAYKFAGVESANQQGDLGSFPRFPPRKITVLNRAGRTGRQIGNENVFNSVLQNFGVPFQVVTDLAALSFEDQVKLMAGTGILVATHGAALTNMVFLPAHSAVIEVSEGVAVVAMSWELRSW